MAQILIMTFGSRGDVQPFVALGQALMARGHGVTLSTGSGFENLIERHGITPAPLPIDVRALAQTPEMQAAMRSLKGKWDAFRAAKDLMQQQMDGFWSVARDIQPDAIVYHPKALAAPYFARALKAVAIPGFLQPAYRPTREFANPLIRWPRLGGAVDRLSWQLIMSLTRLGYRSILRNWLSRNADVAQTPSLDVLGGYHPRGGPVPLLHAHSAHLVAKPADWGENDHVTGAWFVEEEHKWQPSAELKNFVDQGPPPVYVGFGSMPVADPGKAAAAIVDALKSQQVRAILAKGWSALSGATASDDIFVLDAAPHDWLFPRCRAVVHHGGAGTTHESLRWGKPTLVCPVFGDQPFWGRVVQELGAGPKPLPLARLDPGRLSAALDYLLQPACLTAAERLGVAIRREQGTDTAANRVVETLE